jgi:hypothetical protein
MALIEGQGLTPLSDLLDAEQLPLAEFLQNGVLADIIDGFYFTDMSVVSSPETVRYSLRIALDTEITLAPFGADSFSLSIGTPQAGWTTFSMLAELGPDPFLQLVDVPLTLRLAPELLRDVATGGPVQITVTTDLVLSGEGFEITLDEQSFALPLAEIGDTGIQIALTGLGWNFTQGNTLPAAEAAGIEGEFLGVAFDQAMIIFPPDLGDLELRLDYCLVGTGGFTGGVAATFDPPQTIDIGGFQFDLQRAGVRFQQSRLVLGELAGVLRQLPFFDVDVAADVQISTEGIRIAFAAELNRQTDANVAVNQGFLTLRRPGLIAMTLTAAEILIGGGVASVTLSGSIRIEVVGPGGLEFPDFEVKALRIASDGSVSIDGGLINLPEGTRVSIGGFGLELTQVGLGTEPNGDRFATFSGALHLAEGIPLTAAVEGLKIIWNQGGLVGIELAGIALSFEIEGTLRFDGKVHFDDANNRFDGAGRVELIALQMSVEARLMVQRNDGFTSLFIYLLLRSPVGIPLFATGLAFYGFEALYGQHVEPDKSPPELWYRDWYRRPEMGAVDTRKWMVQRNSYAFGAGIILGTLPDGGYALSTKGLLLIVIPGPILMLEVKANLLRDPTALTRPNEPATFNALVVYDGRAGSIELSIEPRYAFPDGGELIEIGGVAEAFYSFSDPRRWYLYLGRREREKRIRAGLLKIFEANAYLMLDNKSLELGGFVGYDAEINAGPVHLVIQSFMEAMAGVSWRPKQLKGMLHMCGKIELKVIGIGFGLGLRALLEAEAPHPFHLLAELAIEIGLPWPLSDLEFEISLEWSDPEPARVVSPLQSVAVEHPIANVSWSLVPGDEPVIPRDGRLILLFDRGMNLSTSSTTTIALDAPSPAEAMPSGEYLLLPSITEIRLEIERGGVWTPYVHTHPDGNAVVPHGVWQEQSGDKSNSNRRLMIDARTSFDWERQLGGSTLTQLARADQTSPCDPYIRFLFVDFDNASEISHAPGTTFQHGGIDWQLDAAAAEVIALSRFARMDQVVLVSAVRSDLPHRGLKLTSLTQLGLGSDNPLVGSVSPFNNQRAFYLRIDLTQNVLGVSVLAYATDPWSLLAFDVNGVLLSRSEWNPPAGLRSGDYVLAELRLEQNGIRFVEIALDGARAAMSGLLILRLAIKIPPIEPDRDAHREQVQELIEAFRSVAPVFEPNSRYRLLMTARIEDANADPRSLEDAILEKTDDTQSVQIDNRVEFTREFRFRTEGPPGGAHLTRLEGPADGNINLNTLDVYIDYTIPAAGATTHYRNYDLSIQFNVDHIAHMYESDGRQLEIVITDQAGRAAVLLNRAGPGRTLTLREHEQTWLDVAGNSCNFVVPQDQFVRMTELHAASTVSLEARNRYEFVLRSNPPTAGEAETPLFKTSFLTSEFVNFRDHFKTRGSATLSLGQLSFADWTAMLSATLVAGDSFMATGVEREARRLIETDAFDALFASIEDAQRELPGNVRLAKVQRAAQTWAMLLESPEPWPWERMELNGRIVPAPPPGSPFDLLDVDIAVARDENGILRVGSAVIKAAFRSNADLRGFTLEVEASEGKCRRSYRTRHLGKDALFKAEEQVTFELDAGPTRRVPWWRRWWVAIQEFVGLRVEGLPDLRLKDPEGRVVATFPEIEVDLGESFPVRVIRDFDGTRAFLIPVGPGGAVTFPAGSYTLEGTFKRSSLPDLPPLSERNDYSDEVARIFWTV